MNQESLGGAVQRILVALDASPDSLAAVEAAAELASGLDAEVVGLFVEEERLLRVGQLSVARELSVFASGPRDIGTRELRRQLRVLARRVEGNLRQIAERSQVPWSFRTVRGEVPEQLRQAACDADLLVVGASGRSVKRGPGSTVRELLEGCPTPLMVLRQATRLGVGVYVLYDGTQEGRRAVGVAARLARDEEHGLTVYLLPSDDQTAEEMAAGLGPRLVDRGLQPRFRRLPRTGGARLAALLRAERCGLFVMPRSTSLVDDGSVEDLLSDADFPVLLVG